MGKDWSKGLTSATDLRVARNAAAHRGLRYRPRKGDRGVLIPLEWSSRTAYIVGLMATDGCLVGDRRHLVLTSADMSLLETFRDLIGKPKVKIRRKTSPLGSAHDLQFGDVALWRFLEAAGLTPRKSLTLGELHVPDECFFDCARGLLDGDGSISNFEHAPTPRQYPAYRYERLLVKFHSASRAHIDWLRDTVLRLVERRGYIAAIQPEGRSNPVYVLTYGKDASIALLEQMYRSSDSPRLMRKYEIWRAYRDRQMHSNVHSLAIRAQLRTMDVTPT